MMNSKFNWSGIDWTKEQDAALARKVFAVDSGDMPLIRGGVLVHPTRERVRQKRMEVYFGVVREALGLARTEEELKVRGMFERVMGKKGAIQRRALIRAISAGNSLGLESSMRLGLARANSIFRPVGWHERKGTIKERIEKLPVSLMTTREIGEAVGCGVSYVSQALREMGLVCKPGRRGREKYAWGKIQSWQWSGPQEWTDKQIARKLGIDNPMVVTQYRTRHGIKKFRRLGERRGEQVAA
jgi:hypothetical protein